MYGYGDIVRFDLSRRSINTEQIPRDVAQRWVGGEGINAWLLWQHFLKVDPRIDPRGPDNIMIFGAGPLGGIGYGAGTKIKLTFKGPAYNMYADSVTGGTFGANLRWAGHDYLTITGKASQPVYIYIENDRIEIRDARHLWGKSAHQAHEIILQETGSEVDVACIGPAGENLVSYASITHGGHRSAARCGTGCVMGSKNLKAIAVRGTKGVTCHDPEKFMEASLRLIRTYDQMPSIDSWKKTGTLLGVDLYQQIGSNHYRNCQKNVMPQDKADQLSANAYIETLQRRRIVCSPMCATACSGWWKLKGTESDFAAKHVGEAGGKPEYLTVASFGLNCDIPDIAAVSYLHKLCADRALDELEIGNACGLLMELWELGIVDERDTRDWFGEPLRFEWGNIDAVLKFVDSVAYQKNKGGQMFRDGVYRGAQAIEALEGVPVMKYVVFGKGGSIINEEVRPFPTWAINMAVSSRGACHLKGVNLIDKSQRKDISNLWFGRPEAGEGFTPTLKGATSARSENYVTAFNLFGICILNSYVDPINLPLDIPAAAFEASTGIPMTGDELYRIGERTYNLEKAFNSRLGMTRAHDVLCDRWMKEPAYAGPGKGMKCEDYFDQVLDEYYEFHGWDKRTGLQTKRHLEELGMGDVAAVLARENVLVS